MQKKTLQDVSRTLQQIVKSLSALPSIASHPSDQMAPSIGSCLDLTDGAVNTNESVPEAIQLKIEQYSGTSYNGVVAWYGRALFMIVQR